MGDIRRGKEMPRKKVLDKGWIEYIGHYGSDELISKIAGISRESSEGPGVQKLLEWGHMSPFEFGNITFLVYMPIFVHRQFIRHRTIKTMERSMRYVIPDTIELYTPDSLMAISEEATSMYKRDVSLYRILIRGGMDQEQARAVLPLGTYILFYCQFDIRHLLDYLAQRDSIHAQPEHREYARAFRSLASKYFPATLKRRD